MSLAGLAKEAANELSVRKRATLSTDQRSSLATPTTSQTTATLGKYIPAETVTLYVAFVSARPYLDKVSPSIVDYVFYFFVLFTPILLLGIFLRDRKVKALGPVTLREWPWGRMIASAYAFYAWGLAIPENPVLYYIHHEKDVQGGVGALIALVVSFGLGFFEPWFEGKSTTSSPAPPGPVSSP